MSKRSFGTATVLAQPAPSLKPAGNRVIVTAARTQPHSQPFSAPDLLPEQRPQVAQPFLNLTAAVKTVKKQRLLPTVESIDLPHITIAFRQLLMTATPQEDALSKTHRFVPELDLWMRQPHMLHQYQLAVITWMQRRTDGGLLCLAMGLGKTLIASAFMLVGTGPVPAEELVKRVSSANQTASVAPAPSLAGIRAQSFSIACLVLVPGPLVSTWLSEVLKFFGKRIRITAHDTKDHMTQADLESHQIVVVTYDQILIMPKTSPAYKVRWRTIVADESQRFVNANTVLFKALRNLTARQKFCLSGTPWNNCSADVVNQLAFVRTINPGVEPSALADADVIPYIHAMNYADVNVKLPPITFETVEVELDKRSRALYEAVEVAQNIKPFVKMQILREISICAWMARFIIIKYNVVPACEAADVEGFHAWLCDQQGTAGAMSAKMQALGRLLAEKGEAQGLIFSAFNESLDLASSKVVPGSSTYQLTSHVPLHARPQIIDSFINGNTQDLFLTYKLGGVGLNLQNCKKIFLMDRWWTDSLIQQAVTRCHRLGQKDPVTVYTIITKNTVEIHVDEVAHTKGLMSDKLLTAASQARMGSLLEDDCDEMLNEDEIW